MEEIIPKTVGESLYLSMATLGMAFASFRHDEPTYQHVDYCVRKRNYLGYLSGKVTLGSFFNDERWKMDTSDACCYCGSEFDLTLDHLIPRIKGGKHSADNLIVACRSCNSSKNALDLLEWMAKKGEFPTLGLLRRYLKLAINWCIENGRMDIRLVPKEGARPKQLSLFDKLETNTNPELGDVTSLTWPFAINLIPHTFPDPIDLVHWVQTAKEQRAEAEWAAMCGPELLAAEKQWQKFGAEEGFILAIYLRRDQKVVEVLKVNYACIEGESTKTLMLHVEAPKLTNDKYFGDYLEWGRDFEISPDVMFELGYQIDSQLLKWAHGFDIAFDDLLYIESLPPTFYGQGIPAYCQAIERGKMIANDRDPSQSTSD